LFIFPKATVKKILIKAIIWSSESNKRRTFWLRDCDWVGQRIFKYCCY